MLEGFSEHYQAAHHFSMDPVFDSVAALYLYDGMDDADAEVRREITDSVVLLDFQELAWTRSHTKAGILKDWRRSMKGLDGATRELGVTKTCKRCGGSFHPSRGNANKQEYCSRQCSHETVGDTCKNGHPLVAGNITLNHGVRTCRICIAAYQKARRARIKQQRESAEAA